METDNRTIVISLGGSIIIPENIDLQFLKRFRNFVLKLIQENYHFVIVAGGGATARRYQQAASMIAAINNEDKDWLGVHATRINAHLLRTIFKKEAYPVVLDSPHKKIKGRERSIYIASGWIPGFSSDYDAVLLAKRFKTKTVINASNIANVYDKTKKMLDDISWKDYRKMIGSRWTPGMNVPFDPIAAKIADHYKITVIVAKGTDLKNLEKIIKGEKFTGTVIHPQFPSA